MILTVMDEDMVNNDFVAGGMVDLSAIKQKPNEEDKGKKYVI